MGGRNRTKSNLPVGEWALRRAAARLEREETIYRLWHEDATTREIAKACKTSTSTITVMVRQMRADGIDLPRRQPQGSTHD
jgi:transposase